MASSVWITPSGVNNTGGTLSFPLGTQITESALGLLAMVSAATTNEFRVPNGSNPEYLTVGWASNQGTIGGVNNSGTARNCAFAAGSAVLLAPNNGVVGWKVDTSGNLMANTDNAPDIGATAATRPRNIFAGTRVTSAAYTVGAANGASFGPSAVASLTVVNGIITAAS
jgi:hypothetical protein